MAKDRALVRNAADKKQVGTAAKREKLRREQELADLRALLELPEARRFLWRLMAHCKTFGSVFSDARELTTYNAGRQDVGHFVMSEIVEADQAKLLVMMTESAAREKTDLDVAEAVQGEGHATTLDDQENPDANS